MCRLLSGNSINDDDGDDDNDTLDKSSTKAKKRKRTIKKPVVELSDDPIEEDNPGRK